MGAIKEKLIRCHNERPEREITSFTRTEEGYVPDKETYCVYCDAKIELLRDQLSIQEFTISGMCQTCQDRAFAYGTF